MFAGTFAGLLTIGNLKPILLNLNIDGKTATLGISIFAVGNALGRIIWGQIHDKLGVRPTVLLSLVCLGLPIIPLAMQTPKTFLLVSTGIIGAGFGACFVVYASSIVKYYGTDLFPSLYPICFLGYGLAGITGPAVGGWIADFTGSFTIGLILSIFIVFAAIILNVTGLFPPQVVKEKKDIPAEAGEENLS
jgi:OFA family oxalate/formate antiporter-like MFS transporter